MGIIAFDEVVVQKVEGVLEGIGARAGLREIVPSALDQHEFIRHADLVERFGQCNALFHRNYLVVGPMNEEHRRRLRADAITRLVPVTALVVRRPKSGSHRRAGRAELR